MIQRIRFLARNVYTLLVLMSRGDVQILRPPSAPTSRPAACQAPAAPPVRPIAQPPAPESYPVATTASVDPIAVLERLAQTATSEEDVKMTARLLRFAKEHKSLSSRQQADMVVDTSSGRKSIIEVLSAKAAMEDSSCPTG